METRRVAAVLAVASMSIGSACGRSGERVVVFAASSLTDVFEELEARYEAAHPDVDVVISFGGSSSLVAQLADGAPADILATADVATMARARASTAFSGEPVVFARNEIVIAVERGNPLGIDDIADLAGDLVVILAAPDVPAGRYAGEVLDCAGVDVSPASLEQNVRSAASKVALGEADAALVYATDVGSGLDAVAVPDDCRVVAEYPIVAVTDGRSVDDLFAYLTGPIAADVLADSGFGAP